MARADSGSGSFFEGARVVVDCSSNDSLVLHLVERRKSHRSVSPHHKVCDLPGKVHSDGRGDAVGCSLSPANCRVLTIKENCAVADDAVEWLWRDCREM